MLHIGDEYFEQISLHPVSVSTIRFHKLLSIVMKGVELVVSAHVYFIYNISILF